MVIPPSRSSGSGVDSIRSDRGWRFQESSQLRNALIKAIAHGKAEPIKASVFTTSNPGNDVGNEVSVDPVDKAGIDPEHIRHSPFANRDEHQSAHGFRTARLSGGGLRVPAAVAGQQLITTTGGDGAGSARHESGHRPQIRVHFCPFGVHPRDPLNGQTLGITGKSAAKTGHFPAF